MESSTKATVGSMFYFTYDISHHVHVMSKYDDSSDIYINLSMNTPYSK